ncbi:putative chitinase 2 [Haematobia irritans]|uniref:putative chitinase 2 n=1 Tax=Haematobia irritans TaxID=7368 RepID=UPI003F50BB0F
MAKLILPLLLIIVLDYAASQKEGESVKSIVNCFYGTWSSERAIHKYQIGIFPGQICTHLSYAFIEINFNEITGPSIRSESIKPHFLNQVFDLKKRFPNLKIMAVFGGSGVKSKIFSQIASKPLWRGMFVKMVFKFLATYRKLDGIDVHWLYPGTSGNDKDRKHFVYLLRELYTEKLKNRNWLLSVSVRGNVNYARKWYFVKHIANAVDFINVMAYNYTSQVISIYHAPLVADQGNVVDTIAHWISEGAPSGKLCLGIALIGRKYRMTLNADSLKNYTSAVPPRKLSRVVTYRAVCSSLANEELRKRDYYDAERGTSSIRTPSKWIAYESSKSIEGKMDFVIEGGLIGVMVWTVDNDDFNAHCSQNPYPLIGVIGSKLKEPRKWTISEVTTT